NTVPDPLALLCTSEFEGFPNTFLEAWSRGVPVVSTLDPDGLIGANLLGFTASSIDGLRLGLERLADDAPARTMCANRAQAYVAANHSPDIAGAAYCRLISLLTT